MCFLPLNFIISSFIVTKCYGKFCRKSYQLQTIAGPGPYLTRQIVAINCPTHTQLFSKGKSMEYNQYFRNIRVLMKQSQLNVVHQLHLDDVYTLCTI